VGEQRRITDRDLLISRLYSDEAPLATRIEIHRRYTVPAIDYTQWVLDLIPWHGDERVADLGCGNGSYIEPVADRLTGSAQRPPQSAQHLVGDLSVEMLRRVDRSPRLLTINLDVMCLPFPEAVFDVILVSHVLHHVPSTQQAVAECRRALHRGGRLLAITHSQTTMAELLTLIREGYDLLGIPAAGVPQRPFGTFTLENGQAILTNSLARVERHVLHNALVFHDPSPVLAYLNSMRGFYEIDFPEGVLWQDLLDVWRDLVSDHIARHGEFRVNKVSGAFVALKQ
jgi:SAM-dependent methyltransferase